MKYLNIFHFLQKTAKISIFLVLLLTTTLFIPHYKNIAYADNGFSCSANTTTIDPVNPTSVNLTFTNTGDDMFAVRPSTDGTATYSINSVDSVDDSWLFTTWATTNPSNWMYYTGGVALTSSSPIYASITITPNGEVNPTFTFLGDAGMGGTSGTCSIKFWTSPPPPNQPPAINPISNATINEGDTFTTTGSFTDPDSTSWTATVNYGDGSGSQPLTLSGANFSLSHQYTDEGTYTVTVKVTDNQGATGTATATVTVNNATPSVGAITVSNPVIQVNSSTTASASFTDAGVLDTHTATWNWGDTINGNPDITTGTVTESNGSGSVSDSHTYTAAGVYTVTLTVTDDDGTNPGTQTYQYVSVYNPTAQGLFSAGQKYTSPAGAYTANTSLSGTVLFGLSYKYQGTMPTGVRQFSMDFNQANFHFNATSVNSLVISNGIGTLTGTGTLTGSTDTDTFLVTGSESANTIRIQIKDASGNVVYDTQPGAADITTPTTAVTGIVLAH